MEFQAVLEVVRSLPIDDQVRLVSQIQDDLETQGIDPGLMSELDKRIGDHDANPSAGIPWEKFEAHIDQRLKELGE